MIETYEMACWEYMIYNSVYFMLYHTMCYL